MTREEYEGLTKKDLLELAEGLPVSAQSLKSEIIDALVAKDSGDVADEKPSEPAPKPVVVANEHVEQVALALNAKVDGVDTKDGVIVGASLSSAKASAWCPLGDTVEDTVKLFKKAGL